jgi:hypothetical protein
MDMDRSMITRSPKGKTMHMRIVHYKYIMSTNYVTGTNILGKTTEPSRFVHIYLIQSTKFKIDFYTVSVHFNWYLIMYAWSDSNFTLY